MRDYTELLDMEAVALSTEDDDYDNRLMEIASLFRGFDEALDIFISEHGYTGDLSDAEAKASFLRGKYKAAGIKPPRDFKEWFIPNKQPKRETMIPICFAFGMDIAESKDFFRRVRFERGLDCHTVNEAVYYFCIKNGLTYNDAQAIIKCVPKPKKGKSLPNREVLYTGRIIEYIDSLDDKEQLIQYLSDNIEDFEYNNATAITDIRKLWTKISKEDGIAVQEGRLIKNSNIFRDRTKRGSEDTRAREVIEKEVARERELLLSDRVAAEEGASTWTVYSQILGLDNGTKNKYSAKPYDRSPASVFAGSALLPLNASYYFPNRGGIDRIIRGECTNSELIRKTLILLVFYTYWAKRKLSGEDPDPKERYKAPARCMDTINQHLSDAGYPGLYSGNPYDWLFMWSLNDESPLEAFRSYIADVFAANETDGD